MPTIKSQDDFYQDYKNEVQGDAPDLTDFEDGSTNDVLGGVVSSAAREISLLAVDQFRKTYITTADGPEVTLGSDDLQTLVVDHFGDSFARPGASRALGTVQFTRPTAAAGAVLIPAGTIVKTAPDATGTAYRYATQIDETMGIGILTIAASVTAADDSIGAGGNAAAGAVNLSESALTDTTIVVTNALAFSGGAPAMNDADYRNFVRNKIQTLKGATLTAIQAQALTVAGVATVTPIELMKNVIECNPATGVPLGGAKPFRIPFPILYIADVNGGASQALLDAVALAIEPIRAAGVAITEAAATALSLDWTASLTLNPAGPNFAALSVSTAMIKATMAQYLVGLPIGSAFVRTTANAALLAIWGSAGSNDISAFATTIPSSDVAPSATQKIVPGTMGTV